MPASRISRRTFLKLAGLGLGAGALACSGLAVLDSYQPGPPITFPETSYGGETMSNRILVAYASCTGSTAGVAEAIGQTLAESGVPVDVRLMKEVHDLSPYRAVVAGSAIQGGKWLPEAMEFMQTQRAALSQRPFAAFLVCMTMVMKNPQYRQGAAAWMEPVRAMVKPVSEGLFAGVLDIRQVRSFSERIKFRLSVLMGVWEEGDHRDWTAIRAWAEGLKPLLGI